MNILVVGRDGATRKITKTILKELKCDDIFEAVDARHSFKIIGDENVDLIISDWELAETSGLELLKKVRSGNGLKVLPTKSIDQVKNTPFILILEEGDRDKIMQAINAKVNQCLIRPITADMLIDKVRAVLKK
ncbi:MAG: response regulator [Desulfobulbaceae bacterium]|nr:response regulator [Desulfobulbaceae bacterium]HIJ79198.1 response regulator [Deltaproteobacteria bacterium]